MNYTIHTNYRKIIADLYTPVSIYNKVRDHFPNALLLESADYHDRSDSISFICLRPIAGFESKGRQVTVQYPSEDEQTKVVKEPREVFCSLEKFIASFDSSQTDLPFNVQGLWGYTSFEAVQYMEDIQLLTAQDELKDNPDLKYQLFQFILVFDHFKNELYITENTLNRSHNCDANLEKIAQLIQVNNLPNYSFSPNQEETSNVTDKRFQEMVEKGIYHCKIGDTFQLVLSREFEQSYRGDDFNVYRCLRTINPSPYLYYFDYGDFKIFGSSPESQLQVFDGKASINPIAGTVLRGGSQAEDFKLAEKLQQNPKEMAEHVMLVDLARNDLSKNAQKVEVETHAEIQYFSHVIHMVSKVTGELSNKNGGLKMYAHTFPAGTLSGAPKYRALEIIAKTENTNRNFYGGSIGFFGFDGSVNHAIIIRSILSKNNVLVYQAGAGIVADSTPDGELQEVNNKVAAIRKAIQKAKEL